jgi:hypothetical protein
MIIGVSITKETTWRGASEEFSNVYHFQTAADVTSKQVIAEVVKAEQTVHGPGVHFKNAKAFGPTDGLKAQNVMLEDITLDAYGTMPTAVTAGKELAAVVQWDTGRKNTRGGRIFYRKYLHPGALGAGNDDAGKGNVAMTQAQQDLFVAFGNDVKNAVGLSGADLTDAKGRTLPFNTPATVLPHLHTRQFRR